MNKYQKIVLSIIVPIITVIIGLAYIASGNSKIYLDGEGGIVLRSARWNDIEATWWIWLLVFIVIGAVELFIFSDKRKK